jgi:hypothetical protein
MMSAQLGRVIYIAAVLFAALVWMLCTFGSLVGLVEGGRPDGFMVAFFAFFGLRWLWRGARSARCWLVNKARLRVLRRSTKVLAYFVKFC